MPKPARLFGGFATASFAVLAFSAISLRAQDTGPQAPPPKFEVKRIPAEPHPGPPPVPEQVIIQRFTANEEAMKKVYETYNFTQSIRMDELTDPGGKFSVTGEVYTRPDGQRYLRVTKQPESTLKLMHFSLEDVRVIASMPEFPLTPDKVANYDFKYAGQEKLDQLNTYIFQVKPKLLSRKERYFQGVVWIDDQDFAIVKSYGKFVSEIEGNGTALPFTMFETYRENFQGKYWLPTYTSSDDVIKDPDGQEVPVHLVIRSTNFKPHGSEPSPATSPSAAPPSSGAPASTSAQPKPSSP